MQRKTLFWTSITELIRFYPNSGLIWVSRFWPADLATAQNRWPTADWHHRHEGLWPIVLDRSGPLLSSYPDLMVTEEANLEWNLIHMYKDSAEFRTPRLGPGVFAPSYIKDLMRLVMLSKPLFAPLVQKG